MVKQIRNGKLVADIMDRGDTYYNWLERKSGLSGPLAAKLAGKEFISIDKLDDVLIESAKTDIRQMYAEEVAKEDADDKDVETIRKSVRGNCCLFEVILRLAIAINEMVNMTEEDQTAKYFGILLDNAGLDRKDDKEWDARIDCILNRKYETDGTGGLFPYKKTYSPYSDRRVTPLWTQMNDWVDEHTNEDGEWID